MGVAKIIQKLKMDILKKCSKGYKTAICLFQIVSYVPYVNWYQTLGKQFNSLKTEEERKFITRAGSEGIKKFLL